MELVDIADEIYRDLESPSDTSISTISFWLEKHVGDLNVALATSLVVESGAIELTEEEKSIFKDIFTVYYYGLQVKKNLGASAYDWSELQEGDSKVRRVSRNEVAKTYRGLKKDIEDALEKKVSRYRSNKSLPESKDAISDLRQFGREDV